MTKPKIESPPKEDPHMKEDNYEIWYFPPENGIVPDIIVAEREDEDHITLWGFQGKGPLCFYALHIQHDHTEDGVCKKWSKYDDQFPDLEQEHNPPSKVQEIVLKLSDAPCVFAGGKDE